MRTPFQLYAIVPFDRSAKVRWLLTELGLPFEDKWVDFEDENETLREFHRITPMGRVPALKMGDEVMVESGAICAYLADHYLERGFAPALTSPDRGSYQQWMYFSVATMDSLVSQIMIAEELPPGEMRSQKEAALLNTLRDGMVMMEQTLARSPFLVGDRFTAADIGMSYHLAFCMLWPEFDAVIRDFPKGISYLEKMKARPAAIDAKVFAFPG